MFNNIADFNKSLLDCDNKIENTNSKIDHMVSNCENLNNNF